MSKKLILGLILACFGPNTVAKIFFVFYLYMMLYIVASYHCMQFQGKLMNQTWENGQKPSFGKDFGLLWPNFGPPKIFVVRFTYTICYTLLQDMIVYNFKEK